MSLRRRALCALSAFAVLVPAAPAQGAPCPDEPLSRPYVLYLDTNPYFLAPGGDFEGASTSWSTAGASLRPYGRLNDRGGAQVLALPWGASATSPPVCVDVTRTQLRFDVRAASLLTRVRVDAVRGDGRVVPLGSVTSVLETLVWDVSPAIPLASRLGLEGDESVDVRLRLTAVSGAWLVDDVAVDPYKRG